MKNSYIWQDFRVEGRVEPARLRSAWVGTGENDLFRVLRVPLRQGRFFNETDPAEGARTVLVNESLARVYWPGSNVIGKQLWDRTDADAMPWTVVGVVGDFYEWGFDQHPEPTIFQPFERLPVPSVTFFVRTTLDPASFMLTVRREVRETVPNTFAPAVNWMDQVLWASTYTRRLYMHFLSAFASAGLLLAALGVYSVFAYSVTRRTREIGIRMALGAQRLSILRLIIGQGVRLILLAIGLGVSASLVLTRFLQAQLFGISPIDPLTFVTGCVLVGLVGLFACYIRSHRASKVDPMVALRYE